MQRDEAGFLYLRESPTGKIDLAGISGISESIHARTITMKLARIIAVAVTGAVSLGILGMANPAHARDFSWGYSIKPTPVVKTLK